MNGAMKAAFSAKVCQATKFLFYKSECGSMLQFPEALLLFFSPPHLLVQVNAIKLLFRWKSRFPQNLEIEKKFVLVSELAQNCKNIAIFKQNYAAKLFFAFKMAYSCGFS